MVDELRQEHSLNYLLKASGLSKSTYFYYRSAQHLKAEENRKNREEKIISIVKPVFEYHKERYGVRRILLACAGELKGINHKTVARVMSSNNLKAKQGKNGKYHSYKGDNGEYKENLLLHKKVNEKGKEVDVRDFSTTKPNEKWTTDVSEFKCGEGKLYLSPILDMYDSSIISYDISKHPSQDSHSYSCETE